MGEGSARHHRLCGRIITSWPSAMRSAHWRESKTVVASALELSRDRRLRPVAGHSRTDRRESRLRPAIAVDDDAAGAADLADEPPSWAGNGSRVTVTNPVDLAMSGDYRKY